MLGHAINDSYHVDDTAGIGVVLIDSDLSVETHPSHFAENNTARAATNSRGCLRDCRRMKKVLDFGAA